MRLALVTIAALVVAGAEHAVRTRFSVILNGVQLGEALSSEGGFYMPVAAVARAVDGDSGIGTPRIRVEGHRLVAVRRGGCPQCPVRVRRAVVISADVRPVARKLSVPMDDVVGAFEGRLHVDSSARRLDIHVGQCTWCILEPSPQSPLDRSTP